MLTVEAGALEFLASKLDDGEFGDGIGLRLMTDGTGFELVPDHCRPRDRVFDVEGRPVLLVAPEIGARIDGRVLECDGGTLKLGLV